MLRLRVDLTAFEVKPKQVFWRLEPDGILYKTVHKYAAHLLEEYGIIGVKPMTFLDGTFLPDSESPQIFRDGDLLRILPGRKLETRAVYAVERDPEIFHSLAPNGTAIVGNSGHPRENGGDSQQMERAIESADDAEALDGTDISETSGRIPKKRKRGKRQSRVRSKRVSFDVLADENGREDAMPQMESTPFKKRVTTDTLVEAENGSSVATRSEAYMTALDATPGVSKQSKTPMKAATARKERKLQAGVGYYLGLLGSGDSSVIAQSSANTSASSTNNHLTPGPSNCGDNVCEDESLRNTSERNKRDGSLLSTLIPNVRISCDLGMFNVKTSGVERYPDVTLEILNNNTEKKFFIVRHIDGFLPGHVSESDFKVDWGMLSSVNLL